MIKEFKKNNGKILQLTESALIHITEGEFSIRPVKNKENMTVLKGGLHTYNGWVKFREKHPRELEHLHTFNSHRHQYWYYARELGNGVITLRIPRELFTGKAAKITMYPDEYYKSGFLWKTLFPKGYDKDRIIMAIEEALANEDEQQSTPGQIVGYINNKDPLLQMKVIIQHRKREIRSVFPSWTQPSNSNNGKPYSHYENIGFIIAQSTEYFNDKEKLATNTTFNFTGKCIPVTELHLYTPAIFLKRTIFSSDESPRKSNQDRKEQIKEYVVTKEENDIIFSYLNDFTIIKFYPEILSGVYASASHTISKDNAFFNSYQIVQNLADGLYYLYYSEQIDRLTQTIVFMLSNMVSHTMLDLIAKKKITSTIIKIVESAKIPELSYKLITSLSTSPIRREAYLEYNLNSIIKKRLIKKLPLEKIPDELCIVMNPNLNINISQMDFIEFLKESLGEVYTLNFKEDELNNMIENLLSEQTENFNHLLEDNLSHLCPDDFLSLSSSIGNILSHALEYKDKDEQQLIACTGLILRDYCRIQFAHRQRVNARYIDYQNYTQGLYLPLDNKLIYGTILKHERWTNYIKLTEFTNSILEFSNVISSKELENDTKNLIKKIGREKPPLPEA